MVPHSNNKQISSKAIVIKIVNNIPTTWNTSPRTMRQLHVIALSFDRLILLSASFMVGRIGGSLAWFTNRKNRRSRIMDIKISFSRITKISKQDTLFNNMCSYTGNSV